MKRFLSVLLVLSAAGFLARAETIQIAGIPHIRQSPDFCGEACVAMALQHLGFDYSQNDVFNAAELDPMLGRGCYARDLAKAIAKIGFDAGPVWFNCSTGELNRVLAEQRDAMVSDLRLGVPSIVCMYFNDAPGAPQHFRLVTGFDPDKNEVLFHDPAEDGGAYRRMPLAQFSKLWPLKTATKDRCLIRFACKPAHIAKPPAHAGELTRADFAQNIIELKANVPQLLEKFEMLMEPPFVVLGDMAAADLQRHAEKTVRWAVSRLKQDYFAKDPSEVIDIWLFSNAISYTNNTKMLIGREPHTFYGFYDDEHHALIMNIKTGGGTLVHEIVHPFIHANFPACPSWFNEGLASLYEQCGDRDGHVTGGTNWRLRGLKDAIETKRLPDFKELTATSDGEFYNRDRGDNYAQARYLCHYLQEHGLLVKFYRDFVKNSATDPTGYDTLIATLGEKDMTGFQKHFEDYVMSLHFP